MIYDACCKTFLHATNTSLLFYKEKRKFGVKVPGMRNYIKKRKSVTQLTFSQMELVNIAVSDFFNYLTVVDCKEFTSA